MANGFHERAVHPGLLACAVAWGGLTAVTPFVISPRWPGAVPFVAVGALFIVLAFFIRLTGLSPVRAGIFDRRLTRRRRP